MKKLLKITLVLSALLLAACGSEDQGTGYQKDNKASNEGNTTGNTATTDSIADSSSNNHNANRADQSGIDTAKQQR